MHFMNKSHGQHMTGKPATPPPSDPAEEQPSSDQDAGSMPDILIKSHSKGHTVHVMHSSGAHEKHEHAKGDSAGVTEHITKHMGGQGQDHGYSSGDNQENEGTAGGPGV